MELSVCVIDYIPSSAKIVELQKLDLSKLVSEDFEILQIQANWITPMNPAAILLLIKTSKRKCIKFRLLVYYALSRVGSVLNQDFVVW
jgi:hypothetical protein